MSLKSSISAKLARHAFRWCTCTACPLGDRARNHAVYDIVPSIDPDKPQILFIGEGPGEAEDVIGKPFIGPSGRLLREAVAKANREGVTVAYANLVVCRPQDKRSGENRTPESREIDACSPRLAELITILDPPVIVQLGRVAATHLPATLQEAAWQGALLELHHPAYIKRKEDELHSGTATWKEWYEAEVQGVFAYTKEMACA